MKRIFLLATTFALSSSLTAWSCSVGREDGFLPKNKMSIPVGAKTTGGLTEEQFNKVIDKVEAVMGPIVTTKGGKLNIERNWSDGTVNAYAERNGDTWNVAMFGGLARHETVTEDGFALVVCHEIGHHIGGAPKKIDGGWWGEPAEISWASNEGQSDYFATVKCLRHVFLNDDNAKAVADMTIPETLTGSCQKSFSSNKADNDLCVRNGMAGFSIARLFTVLGGDADPKFDTPDTSTVGVTDDSHPAAQCRLDTYYQGALCAAELATDVSDSDENVGVCSLANGNVEGNRPLCWFRPSTK